MATVTITLRKVFVEGDRKVVLADAVISGTYTVGGDAPAAGMKKALGLETEVNEIMCSMALGSNGVLPARATAALDKIQLFGNSDASAAVNEASPELTAVAIPGGPVTVRLRAEGKGTAAK